MISPANPAGKLQQGAARAVSAIGPAAASVRDFSSGIWFAGKIVPATGGRISPEDPWKGGRVQGGAALDKLGVGGTRKARGLLAEAASHPAALALLFSNLEPLCVRDERGAMDPLLLPAGAMLRAVGALEAVRAQEVKVAAGDAGGATGLASGSAGAASAAHAGADAGPPAGSEPVSALLGILTTLTDAADRQPAAAGPRPIDSTSLFGALPPPSATPGPRPLLVVDVGDATSLERTNPAIVADVLARLGLAGLPVRQQAAPRASAPAPAAATATATAAATATTAASGDKPASRDSASRGLGGEAVQGPLSGILQPGETAQFAGVRRLIRSPRGQVSRARRALEAVDAGTVTALEALASALPRTSGSDPSGSDPSGSDPSGSDPSDAAAMAGARAAAGVLAQARSLLTWHLRSRRCGVCGEPTVSYDAGVKRACRACGTRVYPRTDCVAIAAVLHGNGPDQRLMVGRQGGWPEGMHSCLSGFIDAGETAEETVRREVGEETGE